MELTAQADQARAALASAAANRNNIYAGVRREQVASLKDEIAKASARLDYVQAQLTRTSTLARQSFESQQSLDQAETTLQAHVPMWRRPRRTTMRPWRARPGRSARSPTRRCRPRRPRSPCSSASKKMVLRAPADGVVSVVAAEVGESVRAGQPILVLEAAGKQWLSFNARENHRGGLTIEKQ